MIDTEDNATAAAELQAAWAYFRLARFTYRRACLAVADTKARLSADMREASAKKLTVTEINQRCQRDPAYVDALARRGKAEDQMWEAVARLEAAWLLNGLPGQRLFGGPES